MKNKIAWWLCRFASWLRGEKWYVADVWHGTPGNRVSELYQRIWQQSVILKMWAASRHENDHEYQQQVEDTLKEIDRNLTELAQTAGESWGHIWPKKKTKIKC